MALSYLNKKKMHPGTFSNMADVWKKEQDELEKQRKAIENDKKLKQERQAEELIKLKVDAGILSENSLKKLDFIYKEGPEVNNVKTKEDLFNNKKIIPKVDRSSDRDNINSKNEIFTRLHEDPLFMMKKDEYNKKKEVEENPLQMKMILKEIEKELLKPEKDKKKKKEKDRHRSKK